MNKSDCCTNNDANTYINTGNRFEFTPCLSNLNDEIIFNKPCKLRLIDTVPYDLNSDTLVYECTALDNSEVIKPKVTKYYLVQLQHETGDPFMSSLETANSPVHAVSKALKQTSLEGKWIIQDVKLIEIIQEDTNQEPND